MYRASFRRKPSAMPLCKSIESAIQWFQIHHGITFVTIHNPAVYLSGARVSISPTLVPRLQAIYVIIRIYHLQSTRNQKLKHFRRPLGFSVHPQSLRE